MAIKSMSASGNTSLYSLGTGDILDTNGFVATLNQDEDCGTITNAKGGTLALSAANVVRSLKTVLIAGTNAHATVVFSGTPSTLTLTSRGNLTSIAAVAMINVTGNGNVLTLNCTAGTNTGGAVVSSTLIGLTSNVRLTVNGTLTGGSAGTAGASNGASAVNYNSAGIVITVNGDVLGGTGPSGIVAQAAVTGSITINGNLRGGAGGAGMYLIAGSAPVVLVTGSITGGTTTGGYGLDVETTAGSITLGTAVGNGYGAAVGTNSASAGVNPVAGVNVGVQTAAVRVYAVRQGALGMPPIVGPYLLIAAPTGNTSTHVIAGAGNLVALVDPSASLTLAAGDLRSGVTVGGVTGTLAVPAAGQVAAGVQVDATVGTAVLTGSAAAAAVLDALAASHRTAGSVGAILARLKSFMGG